MATKKLPYNKSSHLILMVIIIVAIVAIIGFLTFKLTQNKKVAKVPTPTPPISMINSGKFNNIKDPLAKGAENFSSIDIADTKESDIINNINKFTNIKEVYLERDSLKQIPDSLLSMTNLTILWLPSNQITSISSKITNLKQLKLINLTTNLIKTVPPEIGQLTNLEQLDLGANLLTSLPKEVSNLRKLKKLNIESNYISDTEIENIKSLFAGTGTEVIFGKQLKEIPKLDHKIIAVTLTPTPIPANFIKQ